SLIGSPPSTERKAMYLPSGDQERSLAPLGILHTCLASPPSAAIACTCGLSFSPSPLEINASCWLSGDQRGQISSRSPLVKGCASPPDVSTTQIRLRSLD